MEELGDQSLTVALFDRFPIRRSWHNGEWFYSLVDVIAALAGTPTPRRYWSDFKRDLKVKEATDVYALGVHIIKLPDSDGRMQKTDCGNRETVLRIIQSIPSPNAEPFKRWMAQVGNAALEEAEENEETKSLRAQHRLKLHEVDTHLHQLVVFRGITTPEQHQRLRNSNYAGLYAVATRDEVARLRSLPFTIEPEEVMGVMEMAANIFQRAGTAQLVEQRNIQGEDAINATAEDVGVQVRLTMERMGMPMPENLPKHRPLHHTEWLPPEVRGPGQIDWGNEPAEAVDRIIPIYELVEIEDAAQHPDALPPDASVSGLRLIEERHILPPESES
jgi:DNA-damage-inducible protein D